MWDMAVRIPQDSKEYLVVEFEDLLKDISDLAPYATVFTVEPAAGGSDKYTNAAAVLDNMKVKCLIDTSAAHAGGQWAKTTYHLYIKITLTPEVPIFGPFPFDVI